MTFYSKKYAKNVPIFWGKGAAGKTTSVPPRCHLINKGAVTLLLYYSDIVYYILTSCILEAGRLWC